MPAVLYNVCSVPFANMAEIERVVDKAQRAGVAVVISTVGNIPGKDEWKKVWEEKCTNATRSWEQTYGGDAIVKHVAIHGEYLSRNQQGEGCKYEVDKMRDLNQG
eukprot:CAMPEP_0202873450 /NCGR_PEP_ID=MMETSP1391-20130828/23277_1 /ASSEMBLY_ACC=CAM_ASM_000867 /TAXON_ID=1034604 /ORGANISM="Chlamydomonas leiostraca, Strain SAG 11-49" /LENGTH=104 /DNA_ID=CAMNT_0049554671 /DNA_START=124 /DNA_END=434 /DNA_ORIENTATION=+